MTQRDDASIIEFTPAKLAQFRAQYEQTLADGKEVFRFEGRDVLTSYAKYVIEYTESQFEQVRGGK